MDVRKHLAGVELDVCGKCQGVWLDKGELEAIEKKVADEVVVEDDSLKLPELDFSFSRRMQADFKSIDCPRCGAGMETREYDKVARVVVDVCPKGCGMWLDRNELGSLEAFFAEREYKKEAMWTALARIHGG
jgi:Zn-finger nucleic acid-binding protein